jgi:pyruvate dehydrogenase E2 component (dihydrolipoamide acetyltransferase)
MTVAKEIEVKVPDIGGYSGVPVIEILVKPGDRIEKDAALVTLESDKATMDVPAPQAGTVKSLKLKVGDKVGQGDVVLMLESGDGETAAPPPAAPAPKPAAEPPAKAPPAAAQGGLVDVVVPDIGNYDHVPVIEVLVKDGDQVAADASLVTLESDKATMDVPAPAAGTVRELKLKVGDRVSKGTPILKLETAGGSAPKPQPADAPKDAVPAPAPSTPAPVAAAATATPAPASPAEAPKPAAADPATIPYASPAVRKFARELGADLAKVQGSGPRGRITHEDLQAFIKRALQTPAPAAPSATPGPAAAGSGIPAIPAIDFSQFGPVETKPLARIRKLSAAHLHRAWLNVPHVTQTDEADITELEAFRKSQSEEQAAQGAAKLTLLPFVLKACAKVLRAFPEFNSSLSPDGDSLVMKQYVHIGFAADTPNGLVVPVIRDVDRKGIVQLAQESAELAKKARDGKLKPDEMKGGCFSVSSLGGIGGSHFTPIVNAPEVAILGVSRSTTKPVWDGHAFQPRLMVPLSLSYDHRVIDGAQAARFIVLLVKLLSDLRRLSL